MKKLFFILSIGVLVFCLMGCSEEEAEKYLEENNVEYIATSTRTPRESDVYAKKYLQDLKSTYITTINRKIKEKYGYDPVKNAGPTTRYNCHSYAWHSQSTKNPLWIPKPDMYWQDGSYYCRITSNTKIIPSGVYAGDIVVWFDDKGNAQHSAIVKDPKNNIVVSKWGAYGLYEHPLNKSEYDEYPTVKYYSFSGMYDTSGPYPYPRYRQYYTY